MILNILLILLIFLRLIIGIRLLISAQQNKLPNLNWLAFHFLSQFVGLLFAPTEGNPFGNFSFSLLLFIGLTVASQGFLIQFNHATFYRNQKSPVNWFWLAFVLGTIITLYGIFISESNYHQSPWVAAYIPVQWLIWGWHGYIAYQALSKIKQESAIEDWVKARYRLLTTYAIFMIIGTIASFIRIVIAGGSALTLLGTLTGIFTIIAQIITVTGQFLVWVMPEAFRRWLNRHQQARTEAMAQEQAMMVFNLLVATLAETTGLTKLNSALALRKAIGHSRPADTPVTLEAHIAQMGYADWLVFLTSSDLQRMIISSTKKDVYEVLQTLKQTLIEKQSLFTLQSK